MNFNFLDYIKTILNIEEYNEYVKLLNEDNLFKGFNINTLKTNEKEIFELLNIKYEKSAFSLNSYILKDEKINGNSLVHSMGLVYIQEPSASSVVDILDVKENEKVLDMCASPGGKSIQIALRLNNTGLLVSNEFDNKRCITLLSNIERMGLSNVVVTNSNTNKIANNFKEYFEKVLVDAPCSGEGMFRKYKDSINDWSLEKCKNISKLQLEILENAYEVLKENGTLVYSTCTFNKIENEEVIEQFLNRHSDIKLIDINTNFGRRGFKTSVNTEYTRRIFPMDKGEGQFIAKMVKTSGNSLSKVEYLKSNIIKNIIPKEFDVFKNYIVINDNIYGSDEQFINFKDIKVVRNKVLIGSIIKKRFEPHHHFFKSSYKKFNNIVDVDILNALLFQQGNILNIKANKGYVAITYKNQILGFGKSDGNIIKNKYPKALRITSIQQEKVNNI